MTCLLSTSFTKWLRFHCSLSLAHWLLVKVLRLTQHKIGHFRELSQASLLAWYGNTKSNTTKADIHQSK